MGTATAGRTPVDDGGVPRSLGTLTVLVDDRAQAKVVRGGFLGDVRIGDALAGMRHYRPVVLSLVLLVMIGLALPSPTSPDARAGIGGIAAPAEPQPAADLAPPAQVTDLPLEVTSIQPVGFADQPAASISTSGAFSASEASVAESTTTPETDSDDHSVAPSPPARPVVQPLRVASKAWASRTAGTPLAADGVPKGSLPVGKRATQIDKATFVRVTGGTTALTLKLADASGQRSADAAAIEACQITSAQWTEAEAMSFSSAPPYDAAACAAGARNPDGSWTFNLERFPDRTDARGFALVPSSSAPIDFQVAFLPN